MTEVSADPFGELPPPDENEREHGRRVAALLRERIAAGPLGFAEYMRIALYEPGLGYYMAGARKFGAGGDFITAPEVSPLFGAALANQCREVLEALEEPACVLELGAGSGRLAIQILDELAQHDGLRRGFRYSILEPSPELVLRQREALAAAFGDAVLERVDWIERLPEAFRGIIIANEVVDAMPVERFVKRGDGTGDVYAIEVVEHQGTGSPFEDAARIAVAPLAAALGRLEADLGRTLPAGYASELNLFAGPWLASLADALEAGVILIADYGYPRHEYYSPERGGGTLACYYRHRAHHDPYRLPGLEDITAHVDFTTLAEAGTGAGLELLGYNTQSAFLVANGLLELAEARLGKLECEVDRIALSNAVRTLTLPGEMGERFQFIAFGKDYDRALRGFSGQDLTHRL